MLTLMSEIERHTWLNTIVGIIDSAFALSDEEMYFTTVIVRKLLEGLRIPERHPADILPIAVTQEACAGVFSTQLHAHRAAGVSRIARAVASDDTVVTLEAWRQAIMTLILVSYPDLDPMERMWATGTVDELLLALGVPARAAAFFPDEVVRAHASGA